MLLNESLSIQVHLLRDHIIVHRDNGDITYLDGPSEPRKKRTTRAKNIDTIEDTKDGIFNDFDDLDNDSSYVPNDTKTLDLPYSDRAYRCNECGRGFTSESRLATHMKDHRKGRNFNFLISYKLKRLHDIGFNSKG